MCLKHLRLFLLVSLTKILQKINTIIWTLGDPKEFEPISKVTIISVIVMPITIFPF